jgi:hypothetical protein
VKSWPHSLPGGGSQLIQAVCVAANLLAMRQDEQQLQAMRNEAVRQYRIVGYCLSHMRQRQRMTIPDLSDRTGLDEALLDAIEMGARSVNLYELAIILMAMDAVVPMMFGPAGVNLGQKFYLDLFCKPPFATTI